MSFPEYLAPIRFYTANGEFCVLYVWVGTWFLLLRKERKQIERVYNKVFKGIFWPNRDEIRGFGRKVHSEELRNLRSLPYIIRIVKSWIIRFKVRVAWETEMRANYWPGLLKGIGHSVALGVEGNVKL